MVMSRVLQADRRAGNADLAQAGAQADLPGDEGGAPRRAAVLGIIVREHHAFLGDAVDVGRPVAHDAQGIGADIGLADVVAEDDQDVRLGRVRVAALLRLSSLAVAMKRRVELPALMASCSGCRRSLLRRDTAHSAPLPACMSFNIYALPCVGRPSLRCGTVVAVFDREPRFH